MSDEIPENPSADMAWNETALKQGVDFLKQCYAYLEIRIDDPRFELTEEPVIIQPAPLEDDPNQLEYVYPIFDHGDRLISTKQSNDQLASLSMIKMYYTIEKMIAIMNAKLEAINSSGGDSESDAEVLFYFDGHILCMRKAFEVIINLPHNWVVMNFDPGDWGNNYLTTLQKLREKNFEYPPPAPRDYYRHSQGKTPRKPKLK